MKTFGAGAESQYGQIFRLLQIIRNYETLNCKEFACKMFYFWIRRQVRKVMAPIPVHKAQFYTNFFTYAYVLTGWTMFGSAAYIIFGEKRKTGGSMFGKVGEYEVVNPGFYYGRIFRADNMKIYSTQGLSVTKDGEYQYSEDDELNVDKDSKEFFGEEE